MLIEKHEIAKELKKLKGLTPVKSIEDVNGILFKENMLIASNLEITVISRLEVNTEETFGIPMKAIDYIESLPAGEIEITAKDNRLTVKSKIGKSSFSTFGVDDFPTVDIVDLEERQASFGYDCEAISEKINQILYAVAQNSFKPVMNGALFEADGKYLSIVGCDGYRLAWNQIDYPGKFKVVIPKATIQKVLSLGLTGSLELYSIDEKKAVFKTDKYTVYTRLLEGDYINYKKMFQEEGYDTMACLKRMDLLESVARALICCESGGASKVVLESNTDGSKLILTAKNTVADFMEEISLYQPVENKIKIAFNPRFLIDSLKVSTEMDMNMHFKNSDKAVFLIDGVTKQLVLPMRM